MASTSKTPAAVFTPLEMRHAVYSADAQQQREQHIPVMQEIPWMPVHQVKRNDRQHREDKQIHHIPFDVPCMPEPFHTQECEQREGNPANHTGTDECRSHRSVPHREQFRPHPRLLRHPHLSRMIHHHAHHGNNFQHTPRKKMLHC